MNERVFPINLESLIELSARLNETHDNNFILNAALLSLMGKLTISGGCALVPDSTCTFMDLPVSKGHYTFVKHDYFEVNDFTVIKNNDEQFGVLYRDGVRYLVPVLYRNKLLAIICLSKRLIDNSFTDNEKFYIKLVSSITANAMQISNEHNNLKNTKNKLEYRNLTLTTLFEISREFSSIRSFDKIIKTLSLRLMGQLMVNKFALYIIDSKKNIEPVINRCDKEINPIHFQLLLSLSELSTRKNINPPELKSIFDETEAEVIAPLLLQNEIKGILVVGPKLNKTGFSNENLNFIESLGITAITALENERLFSQELEKKRLESELDLALEIQKGLLPKNFSDNELFSIHGFSNPSRFVGGDYFDYFYLPEKKLIVVIADVAGKGIAASLIMANLQSALKVLATLNLNLTEIANRLNNVVYANTSSDRFVTFFLGQINLNDRTVEFINAGHNPPFMIDETGNFESLSGTNVPLGIFDSNYSYSSETISFNPGSRLILYTDGITEAMNTKNKEFGESRLIELVRNNINSEPKAMSEIIAGSINEFSKGKHQYDDITCLNVLFK